MAKSKTAGLILQRGRGIPAPPPPNYRPQPAPAPSIFEGIPNEGLHGYLGESKSRTVLKLTSKTNKSQSRSQRTGPRSPSSQSRSSMSPPWPPARPGSTSPRKSPCHQSQEAIPEKRENNEPAQTTAESSPSSPSHPRPPTSCPPGGRRGEAPHGRPSEHPEGLRSLGTSRSLLWTSTSCPGLASNGAQNAAPKSCAESRSCAVSMHRSEDDNKLANKGTAPRCGGDGRASPANTWPQALLKKIPENKLELS